MLTPNDQPGLYGLNGAVVPVWPWTTVSKLGLSMVLRTSSLRLSNLGQFAGLAPGRSTT